MITDTSTHIISIDGIDYPILGRGWCAYGVDDVRKLLMREGAQVVAGTSEVVRNDYSGCNYRLNYRANDVVRCAYIHEAGETAYIMTAPCPIPALERLGSRSYGQIVGGDTDVVDTRPAPLCVGVWSGSHEFAKHDTCNCNGEDDDTWDLDDFFEPRTKPQIETWQSVNKVVIRMAEAICRAADSRNASIGHDTHTTVHDEWVDSPDAICVLCMAATEALADETLRRVAGQIVGDDVAYDMGTPVTCSKLPDAIARARPSGHHVLRKITIVLRLGLEVR